MCLWFWHENGVTTCDFLQWTVYMSQYYCIRLLSFFELWMNWLGMCQGRFHQLFWHENLKLEDALIVKELISYNHRAWWWPRDTQVIIFLIFFLNQWPKEELPNELKQKGWMRKMFLCVLFNRFLSTIDVGIWCAWSAMPNVQSVDCYTFLAIRLRSL